MDYFIGSIGKVSEDYTEANFIRIVDNVGYVVYDSTGKSGIFNEIKIGDIIILRYDTQLVAYGLVNKVEITDGEEWNHWAYVDEWYWHDSNNRKKGINRYGVSSHTIDGGYYDTIKKIAPVFAIKKLEEINASTSLYHQIEKEMNSTIEQEYKKSIVNLLKYKKQIILQGPPGTGKTRLAEEIASEILNTEIKDTTTPLALIEKFFIRNESQTAGIKDFDAKLLEFQTRFPKDEIQNMDLEDYCIGKGNRDNFCWWLETGLKQYGKFSPGQSGNYVVYFSRARNEYTVAKFDESIETIFPKLKRVLEDLIVNKNIDSASQFYGESFILKILSSYYPNEYFPVNGKNALNRIAKILNLDTKNKSAVELNSMLKKEYEQLKSKYNSTVTSFDFMFYLFKTFNLNDNGDLLTEVEGNDIKRMPILIQFHPSYSYEDFVRGLVAEASEKGIEYKVENKVLANIAKEAIDNPYVDYILIIDEINRANLSSVLGELIYALEYRGRAVESPYALKDVDGEEDRSLTLPENLFIIGTMNTADRSVGNLDYAIRRRFAFVDLLPKDLTGTLENTFDSVLFDKVKCLFTTDNYKTSSSHLSNEFKPKDVALGHSYFIDKSKDGANMNIRLEYEIKPILREYVRDGILKDSALSIIEDLNVDAED